MCHSHTLLLVDLMYELFKHLIIVIIVPAQVNIWYITPTAVFYIKEIDHNLYYNSPAHHFNSEAFAEGRRLITDGVASIKANIQKENFLAARETLGRVLHTLQVRGERGGGGGERGDMGIYNSTVHSTGS